MQILFVFIIYSNHKIDKPHVLVDNDSIFCFEFVIQRKKVGNKLSTYLLVQVTGLEPA